MSTVELKKQVMDKLKNADEDLLKKIQAAIDDYEEHTIVAHTVLGKPLTIKEYREEIFKAEKDLAEGRFYTTSELKAEMEKWKK